MEKLKPCPFCGSKEIQIEYCSASPTSWSPNLCAVLHVNIRCLKCTAMIRPAMYEDIQPKMDDPVQEIHAQAIRAWNKRV